MGHAGAEICITKSRVQRGFTLLELLVAIALFALVSVMAYRGLDSILVASERIELQATRLTELQKGMSFLLRDMEQVVARPVRDRFGDRQAALRSDDVGDLRLQFTRGGVPNPVGLTRSQLQRIGYALEDDELIRLSWPQLDGADELEARRRILIEQVEELQFRFMNRDRDWVDEWPPGGVGGEPALADLPLAVEITLVLSDWGTLLRIFPLTVTSVAANQGAALAPGEPQ